MDNATATVVQNRQAAGQPDLRALKSRQQAAWSSGDYALIGTTLQIVGEELCEALDVRSGQKVLDIALVSGFGVVSNFNRAFRTEFGVSPRTFRTKH